MGSGISGNYQGTNEESQSYQNLYHVENDMLTRDKDNPNIYSPSSGYFKKSFSD
jgi:uncharacterized protein with NRDE domain